MKKITGIFLAIVMSLTAIFTLNVQKAKADVDWVKVSDWDSLVTALERDDERTVILTANIKKHVNENSLPWAVKTNFYKYYQTIDEKGEILKSYCGIVVKGSKVLDLNGYQLVFDDCSNAQAIGPNKNGYYSLETGLRSTFLLVDSGASLTVSDSKGGGKLGADGYYIGKTNKGDGIYWDFYGAYCTRNLIEVQPQAELFVTGGELIAGGAKKQFLGLPLGMDGKDKSAGHDAFQVIRGSAVTVRQGGLFTSVGGVYEGHFTQTIDVNQGALVRFYDGNVQGECSADCFRVADGAIVKLFGGKFETFYHSYIRHLDRMSGYNTSELTGDLLRDIFEGGIRIFDSPIWHNINGTTSSKAGNYDYGCIGIPVSAFNTQYYTVKQNGKDSYDPSYKGNTTVTPKSLVRFDVKSDAQEFISQAIDYHMGEDMILGLYALSRNSEGKYTEYTPDFSDTILNLTSESSRRYLWEFMATEKGNAELSFEGDAHVNLKTFADSKNSWFSSHPDCYVRCSEIMEWRSEYNYKVVYSSYTRPLHITKACSHNWKLLTDTSTCAHAGEKTYQCTNCSRYKSEAAPATGKHVSNGYYYSLDLKNHATYCKYCGQEMSKEAHQGEVIKKVPIDCTKAAVTYQCKKCKLCWSEIVEESSHSFGQNQYDAYTHWAVCEKCGVKRSGSHTLVHNDQYGRTECEYCGYIEKYDYESAERIKQNSNYICPHQDAVIDVSELSAGVRQKIQNGQCDTMGWFGGIGNELLAQNTLTLSMTPALWTNANNWAAEYGNNYILFQMFVDQNDWDTYFETSFTLTKQSDLVRVDGYPATCSSEGRRTYYVCTCGRRCNADMKEISDADIIIPKTAHTYDNACDPYCNVCNAERQVSHQPGANYESDENYHWKTCKVCGIKLDVMAHVPVVSKESESSCQTGGKRIMKCTDCGRVLYEETFPKGVHANILLEESPATCTGAGQVTLKCADCGEIVSTATVDPLGHALSLVKGTPSDCMTEGTGDYYECSRCGLVFEDVDGTKELSSVNLPKDPENHVGGALEYDEENHWTLCECGAVLDKEKHTLRDDGCCEVCDYAEVESSESETDEAKKDTDEDKKETKNDMEDEATQEKESDSSSDDGSSSSKKGRFPWWLLLLILLLLAAGGGAFFYLKKKKEKEKEPEPEAENKEE